MSFWIPVAAASAGYLIDRQMGGDGLKGALLGGSLGYGGMGSGSETATAEGGGKGVTGMDSAIPESNTLLGSTNGNAIPSYDIGMEGVKANIGGFTAPVEQSLVNANTYQPLNGGIAPDMSFKQNYINTTPEQGLANLGTPQRPNINEYPTIMGGEGSTVGIDTTSRDTLGNYESIATRPDFTDITKSSPEELANAQGGYDKPLYEKAFDSMVGFAEKNPLALATLGMTALGGFSNPNPQQAVQSAGQVARQAYNPRQSDILKVRRA